MNIHRPAQRGPDRHPPLTNNQLFALWKRLKVARAQAKQEVQPLFDEAAYLAKWIAACREVQKPTVKLGENSETAYRRALQQQKAAQARLPQKVSRRLHPAVQALYSALGGVDGKAPGVVEIAKVERGLKGLVKAVPAYETVRSVRHTMMHALKRELREWGHRLANTAAPVVYEAGNPFARETVNARVVVGEHTYRLNMTPTTPETPIWHYPATRPARPAELWTIAMDNPKASSTGRLLESLRLQVQRDNTGRPKAVRLLDVTLRGQTRHKGDDDRTERRQTFCNLSKKVLVRDHGQWAKHPFRVVATLAEAIVEPVLKQYEAAEAARKNPAQAQTEMLRRLQTIMPGIFEEGHLRYVPRIAARFLQDYALRDVTPQHFGFENQDGLLRQVRWIRRNHELRQEAELAIPEKRRPALLKKVTAALAKLPDSRKLIVYQCYGLNDGIERNVDLARHACLALQSEIPTVNAIMTGLQYSVDALSEATQLDRNTVKQALTLLRGSLPMPTYTDHRGVISSGRRRTGQGVLHVDKVRALITATPDLRDWARTGLTVQQQVVLEKTLAHPKATRRELEALYPTVNFHNLSAEITRRLEGEVARRCATAQGTTRDTKGKKADRVGDALPQVTVSSESTNRRIFELREIVGPMGPRTRQALLAQTTKHPVQRELLEIFFTHCPPPEPSSSGVTTDKQPVTVDCPDFISPDNATIYHAIAKSSSAANPARSLLRLLTHIKKELIGDENPAKFKLHKELARSKYIVEHAADAKDRVAKRINSFDVAWRVFELRLSGQSKEAAIKTLEAETGVRYEMTSVNQYLYRINKALRESYPEHAAAFDAQQAACKRDIPIPHETVQRLVAQLDQSSILAQEHPIGAAALRLALTHNTLDDIAQALPTDIGRRRNTRPKPEYIADVLRKMARLLSAHASPL